MSRDLRELQVNLGRDLAARQLAHRKVRNESFDIVLVQEPHRGTHSMLGYMCFKADGEGAKVATYVRTGIGRVFRRNDYVTDNVVAVEVESERGKNLIIVNVYDEPPNVANSESRFRDVTGWLSGRREKMLVAGDLNGKNEAWGSERGDKWTGVLEWARDLVRTATDDEDE